MRKITQNAIHAFNNNTPFSQDNTSVHVVNGTTTLLLHGNTIAIKDSSGLRVTNAGWFTNTTKERLNGLLGVSVYQRKGSWYLNGELWDGELILVN